MSMAFPRPSLVFLVLLCAALPCVQADAREFNEADQQVDQQAHLLDKALESFSLVTNEHGQGIVISDAEGEVDPLEQLRKLSFSFLGEGGGDSHHAERSSARRRRRRANAGPAPAAGSSAKKAAGSSAGRRRFPRRRAGAGPTPSPAGRVPSKDPNRSPGSSVTPTPVRRRRSPGAMPTLMPGAPLAVRLCRRKSAWDKCNQCGRAFDDECYKFCLPTKAKPPPASPYTGQLHCATPAHSMAACMGRGVGAHKKAGDACVWASYKRPGVKGDTFTGRCQAATYEGTKVLTCVKVDSREQTEAEEACKGKSFRSYCHTPSFVKWKEYGYCVQGPAAWNYRLYCEKSDKPVSKEPLKGEKECADKEWKDCCKVDGRPGSCKRVIYPQQKILKIACTMFTPGHHPSCNVLSRTPAPAAPEAAPVPRQPVPRPLPVPRPAPVPRQPVPRPVPVPRPKPVRQPSRTPANSGGAGRSGKGPRQGKGLL